MKSKNTFGVHFTLRLSRSVNGKFPIYIRIVVNKSRVELALKCFLPKEDWNGMKGLPKPKNEDLKQLTCYLEEVKSKIINHYRELEISDQELAFFIAVPIAWHFMHQWLQNYAFHISPGPGVYFF